MVRELYRLILVHCIISHLHFIPGLKKAKGTNPEELIAAAHAGCFSMALSAQLEKEGIKAEQIKTTATVTLEKSAEGFSIPAVHLEVVASKAIRIALIEQPKVQKRVVLCQNC